MIEIVQADALTIRPEFFDQFHALITDPPYSAHVHASATSHSARGGTRKRDLGFESLSYRMRRKVAEGAARVQRWTLAYSDVESANYLAISMQAAGAGYVRIMPWIRWSMPQLTGDRPPQGFEVIVCAHRKGKKRWNGPGNLTHLDELCLRGEGKHKTEKPLDQMLRLVSYFTDPGESVIDICSGSGTTALACALLGRHCFAVELDPGWATRSQERLERAFPAGRSGPALEDRDWERIRRWLARDDEPVSAQTEGPSLARAQARARDKQIVRDKLGIV